MSFTSLLRAFISARWLPYSLTVLLMALGMAVILLLLSSEQTLKEKFLQDAQGVDLVVGAKGSPLQLVLSSLYHIDAPTGNIAVKDADALCKNNEISLCIPLALGDNYQGFRIVGTDVDTVTGPNGLWGLHNLIGDSQNQLDELEAHIGYDVAQQTGLKIGSAFLSSHGLIGDGHVHDEKPFTIVKVLPKTGTIADQLILTSVESIHKIHTEEGHDDHDHGAHDHSDHDDHDHKDEHNHDEHDHHDYEEHKEINQASQEITALLIKVKNPRSVIGLPRWINKNTSIMAAHPAMEITRLYAMLGGGLDSLRTLSFAVVGASLLSLFIMLYTSLSARLPDLAMLRVLGWSRGRISKLVLAEGLLITLIGLVTGIILAVIALPLLTNLTGLPLISLSIGSLLSKTTVMIVLVVLTLAILACLIPVQKAYRLSIPKTLS